MIRCKDILRCEIADCWQPQCEPRPQAPDKVGFSFLVVAVSWWIAVTRTTRSNLNFINSFLVFSKHPLPHWKKGEFKYFNFRTILFRVWTSNAKLPQIAKLELAERFDLRKFWISSAWFEAESDCLKYFYEFGFLPQRFTKYIGASAPKPFQALSMFEYFIHKDFSILPVVVILWTRWSTSTKSHICWPSFCEAEEKRLSLIHKHCFYIFFWIGTNGWAFLYLCLLFTSGKCIILKL